MTSINLIEFYENRIDYWKDSIEFWERRYQKTFGLIEESKLAEAKLELKIAESNLEEVSSNSVYRE